MNYTNYDDIKKAEYDKLHHKVEVNVKMPYEQRKTIRKVLRMKRKTLVGFLNTATTRQERHRFNLELQELDKRINTTMPEQYDVELI
jgi:hypothetical protein